MSSVSGIPVPVSVTMSAPDGALDGTSTTALRALVALGVSVIWKLPRASCTRVWFEQVSLLRVKSPASAPLNTSAPSSRSCTYAAYAAAIHPYRDGRSADRVIDTIEALVAGRVGQRRRPWTDCLRALRIRAHLGYWGSATRVRSRSRSIMRAF